jgi:16S rRNA (cytosine967-C5)-methyltransferase
MNAPARAGFAPGATALALAATALQDIRETGCTAEDALARASPSPHERGAVRAILAGTLRWYLRLLPLADALLKTGQQAHPSVHALIVTTLHQLEYSRAAAASVVNIAVDATRVMGQPAASGFINAVLRRYLREREALLAKIDLSEPAAVAHPRWLLREIHAVSGQRASAVVAANNESPPMTLRVNLARTTRDDFLKLLSDAGVSAAPGLRPTTLVLEEACEIDRLPGFAAGLVSVQDAGAQYAAELLDAQPGDEILDACAAPGGKTGHLFEHTPNIKRLTALDISADRLARVQENIGRLGYEAELLCADLFDTRWSEGRSFDRILLDAPCTATGVIRRHPDIKLLRRASDATGFASTQRQMLDRCAALLRPGGLLVYATCSILDAENRNRVEAFLAENWQFERARPDLRLLPMPRSAGPGAVTDGFYYACLKKGAPQQDRSRQGQ